MMFLDIAENSAAMKRAKKEAYFQVSCLYSYNDTSRMNPTSDFFFLTHSFYQSFLLYSYLFLVRVSHGWH